MSGRAKSNKKTTITFAIDDRFLEIIRDDANSQKISVNVKDYPVQPQEAFYHTGMGEFLLPYNTVRNAKSPDDVPLTFLQTTYEAAATCAKWDRDSLERQ